MDIEFYVKHMKKTNPDYKDLQFDKDRMKWVKQIKEVVPRKRKDLTEKGKMLREFVKIRGIVLDRDDYTCVHCGNTDRIQVHHIQALSAGGDNMADNLITLCYKCHMKEHEGQKVHDLMAKQL